jgi:hypothetical protein
VPFDIRVSGLESIVIGVQLGEAVDPELEGVLDGHDSLSMGNFVHQGSQQRRLSRSCATGNDDVPFRADTRFEKSRDFIRHQAPTDELDQRRQMELMLANDERWMLRHVHDGEEPTSILEAEVALG